MRAAAHSRSPLPEARFDIAVIGGGINGIAIARECARAGQRTLLLEKNDFASGTTSRSTRIIHGGLRYMEHGELALVRESLKERNRLLCERPYLVRPMRFVLALPKQRSPFSLRGTLAIRAGLGLYHWYARNFCQPQKPDDLDRRLDLGDELSLFDYEDAQCEFPERLAAEWLAEAAHFGASVRNYAQVLAIKPAGNGLSVRFHDGLDDVEYWIEASKVVNASGPWVDQVCSSAFKSPAKLIKGVRGSHILLERFEGAPASPVYSEAPDRRPFFIVPWNKQLLVGTTEVNDDTDPGDARASDSEIKYLLDAWNCMFPRQSKTLADVRGTMSGVRPLPNQAGNDDLNALTRRSFIHDHASDGFPGLFSIIGGKLTTAASLARHCARALGVRVQTSSIPLVAMGPASGFDNTLDQWSQQAASQCRVSPQVARATAEWHGPCAFSILRRAMADHSLAHPIVEGSDHILAEVAHALQREYAVTLGDVLLRRVPIALTIEWSRERSMEAAGRIGRALGWAEAQIHEELRGFEAERSRLMNPRRGSHGAPDASARTEHTA